ncbi:MAG: hypothetical protein IKC80_00605, partial [Kiritimatiellae bacterium]|nr:hypothetical protein [Kiritimatiellia bacterium]
WVVLLFYPYIEKRDYSTEYFIVLKIGSTRGLGKVKRGGVRRFEHMEIDSKRVSPGGVSRSVVDLHKSKEL